MTFTRLVGLFLITILIAGCGANPVKTNAPEILGKTSYKGKGVPNGRSDSKAQFAALKGVSSDPSYGYTKANPINVGVGNPTKGPASERYYLNALRSSKGLPIAYERLGSCCVFKTPNGIEGAGLLDVFAITTPDSPKPRILYVNFYDPVKQPALAPLGFTTRKLN